MKVWVVPYCHQSGLGEIEVQSEIELQSPKLKIEDSPKSFLRIFSLRPREIEV